MRITSLLEILICITVIGIIVMLMLNTGVFGAAQKTAELVTPSPDFYLYYGDYSHMTLDQIAEQDTIHIIPYEDNSAAEANSD